MTKVFDVPDGLPDVFPRSNTKEDSLPEVRRRIFNSLYSTTNGKLVRIGLDGLIAKSYDIPNGLAPHSSRVVMIESLFTGINPIPFGQRNPSLDYGAGLAIGDTAIPNEGMEDKSVEDDELSVIHRKGTSQDQAWRFLFRTAHHLSSLTLESQVSEGTSPSDAGVDLLTRIGDLLD